MSTLMEDDIKRWTAKRKAALVMEIIQGKTTVAEASIACISANSLHTPEVKLSQKLKEHRAAPTHEPKEGPARCQPQGSSLT